MSYKHLLADNDAAEQNKKNQSKVVVSSSSVSCPDVLSLPENRHHVQQKHPRVMLHLKENQSGEMEGVCYYCGTVFVHQPKK